MKLSNKIITVAVLISVVIISGCSQAPSADKTPSDSPDAIISSSPEPTSTPTKTPEPSPVQVSVGGDALGSEIAKSDSLYQDVGDSDLDDLNSDLGEIETGL